ncbi:MAG TPA: protein translocase subunit SecD [Planctomycetota bacterium]
MAQDTRIRFIVTLVLTALAALAVAPMENKPFFNDYKIRPGIDLEGGAELRVKFLYAEGETNIKERTAEAADIIRKRVEAKQLKEPRINQIGDDGVVIQLAGVDRQQLEEYKKLLLVGGKLELFETAPQDVQERYNQTKVADDGWKVIENPHPRRDAGYTAWGEKMLIRKQPILTGRSIVRSEPQSQLMPGTRDWYVTFELDAEGSKLFDEAATRLFSYRPPGMIAIMLDEKLNSAPTVQTNKFGGSGRITGIGGEGEAKNLSIILRSGKLPGKITLEQETFVGPTLGQDAIRRGKLASGITLSLAALFMLVYYRKAGLVAVVSLVLNLLFLMGIMAFANATMTLPGLAGIVLTVGMALDANILIYERMREEQQRGKTALQAYEAGHERAFSAIVDSNITTLLAAAVLYWFGTGPVQGFAVTLSIGILTTLFSVLFCARTFLKMMISAGTTEFKMMKLMAAPKLEYLRAARKFVTVSAILVAAGVAFVGVRGEKVLGMDFLGGSAVTFKVNEKTAIQAIRDRIRSVKGTDGNPRYPDAELQTITNPEAGPAGGASSETFQLRTGVTALGIDGLTTDQAMQRLKVDIQDALKDVISHEPFETMKPEQVSPNPRLFDGEDGRGGVGLILYVKAANDLEAIRKKISEGEAVKTTLSSDAKGNARVHLDELPGSAKGLRKLALTISKADAERDGITARLQDALQKTLKGDLAEDPFVAQDQLGSAVAKELRNSTVRAMIVSWVLMIIYIAFRFDSWKYGVSAVIALVHDSLITIAFIALAGALAPKSWGLSFEMGLTTMAAILTIIGYAINDKIVVFDRIRENLQLMKKESFTDVINASVNQTMSRTMLTGVMVWVAAIILYVLTMHTGGGIAEFSFPLIVGILAGTYSTIWIACPIVLWWYKGKRPDAA